MQRLQYFLSESTWDSGRINDRRLELQQAVTADAARVGLLYMAATATGALVVVWTGAAVTGWAVRHARAKTDSRKAGESR